MFAARNPCNGPCNDGTVPRVDTATENQNLVMTRGGGSVVGSTSVRPPDAPSWRGGRCDGVRIGGGCLQLKHYALNRYLQIFFLRRLVHLRKLFFVLSARLGRCRTRRGKFGPLSRRKGSDKTRQNNVEIMYVHKLSTY